MTVIVFCDFLDEVFGGFEEAVSECLEQLFEVLHVDVEELDGVGGREERVVLLAVPVEGEGEGNLQLVEKRALRVRHVHLLRLRGVEVHAHFLVDLRNVFVQKHLLQQTAAVLLAAGVLFAHLPHCRVAGKFVLLELVLQLRVVLEVPEVSLLQNSLLVFLLDEVPGQEIVQRSALLHDFFSRRRTL